MADQRININTVDFSHIENTLATAGYPLNNKNRTILRAITHDRRVRHISTFNSLKGFQFPEDRRNRVNEKFAILEKYYYGNEDRNYPRANAENYALSRPAVQAVPSMASNALYALSRPAVQVVPSMASNALSMMRSIVSSLAPSGSPASSSVAPLALVAKPIQKAKQIFKSIYVKLEINDKQEEIKSIRKIMNEHEEQIFEKEKIYGAMKPSIQLPEKECCCCKVEFIVMPEKIATLGCGHLLCITCAQSIPAYGSKCPICRTPFTCAYVKVNTWLRDILLADPMSKMKQEINGLKLERSKLIGDVTKLEIELNGLGKNQMSAEELIFQFKNLKDSDNEFIKKLFE
jgi:hypothetical protein